MAEPILDTITQWWHDHRPYPIRDRIWTAPSHPVVSEAGTRLIIACEPELVVDAAWTARSFLHRLDRAPAGRLALDLYVDLPDPAGLVAIKDRWVPLFPGSVVYSIWEAVEKLAPTMPSINALAMESAAIRRLAVVLRAQADSNVIVAAPDVLLLGNSAELADALRDGSTALHLQSHQNDDADPSLREYARQNCKPLLAESLDPSLLYLPRASLSSADAELLLADGELRIAAGPAMDRALLALLLGANGAQPLSPERYVATERDSAGYEQMLDAAHVATRRYGPAIHHLMYASGMPRLWDFWQSESVKTEEN